MLGSPSGTVDRERVTKNKHVPKHQGGKNEGEKLLTAVIYHKSNYNI